jgi:hypothetical protein
MDLPDEIHPQHAATDEIVTPELPDKPNLIVEKENLPGTSTSNSQNFFFFLIAIPVFIAIRLLRYLSVGRFFNSFPCSFAYILSSGDATGLRGTFPGHPRPFHLTFTDIHNNIYNIYTPMGALPDGTRTRADLAVVAERVLILPSTTLPSAPRRHTHTSMAGRSFLPLKKSSPLT